MLSGQMLGVLNNLVTDIKAKDPENEVTEIHIGAITPLFNEAFRNSQERGAVILLCEVGGLLIFMNYRFGNGWAAVKNGESWKDHLHDGIVIDGVKPSKTWLKNNLNIFKKKGGKQHE
jgi:hypothetical protein